MTENGLNVIKADINVAEVWFPVEPMELKTVLPA